MKIDIKKLIAEAAESVKQDIATGKLKLNEAVSAELEVPAIKKNDPAMAQKVKDFKQKNPNGTVVYKEAKEGSDDSEGITDMSSKGVLKLSFKKADNSASKLIKALVGKASVTDGSNSYVKGLKQTPTEYTIEIKSKTPEFKEFKAAVSRLDSVDDVYESDKEFVQNAVGMADAGGTVQDIIANRKSEPKPYTPLKEKKGDDAEAPDSVEGEEAAPDPAEQSASPSDDLQAHIAAAIDSAAKCLGANEDRKYEAIIGKITAQLTKAQDYLGGLKGKESELAEQAEAKKKVEYEKYFNLFLKSLNKMNPDKNIVNKIVNTYQKLANSFAEKKIPADKAAKQVYDHFVLNEGKVGKKSAINEAASRRFTNVLLNAQMKLPSNVVPISSQLLRAELIKELEDYEKKKSLPIDWNNLMLFNEDFIYARNNESQESPWCRVDFPNHLN